MAQRPTINHTKQAPLARHAQRQMSGGGFYSGGYGDNKDLQKIIDPGDFGETLFGAGAPERPDLSEIDQENEGLYKSLQDGIPQTYTPYEYGGDVHPSVINLGNSAMDSVYTDPKMREYQLRALQDLEDQSHDGLTARDKADLAATDASVNRQHAGRLGAIQQNMAERGIAGSGQELAMKMMADQAATEQEAQRGLEINAQRQAGRQQATANLGALSGQQRQQDFEEQSQKAQAQDAIDRFNATYGMNYQNQAAIRNQNARQNTSDNNVQGQNAFRQRTYQNQVNATTPQINANTQKANESLAQYQNEANAYNQKKQQGMQNIGKVGSTIASFFSDEHLKEDIHPLSDNDIEEFLDSISPKKFRYKDQSMGQGERLGTMAQDLEHSKLGRDIVKDTPHGKAIDIVNAIGMLLDSVAHLNQKVG